MPLISDKAITNVRGHHLRHEGSKTTLCDYLPLLSSKMLAMKRAHALPNNGEYSNVISRKTATDLTPRELRLMALGNKLSGWC